MNTTYRPKNNHRPSLNPQTQIAQLQAGIMRRDRIIEHHAKRIQDLEWQLEYRKSPKVLSEIEEVIFPIVTAHTGIEVWAMKAQSRITDIREARQIAQYCFRKYSALSLFEIGVIFGNRHHSTIIHSCEVVIDLRDTEKPYRIRLEKIESEIINKIKQ